MTAGSSLYYHNCRQAYSCSHAGGSYNITTQPAPEMEACTNILNDTRQPSINMHKCKQQSHERATQRQH